MKHFRSCINLCAALAIMFHVKHFLAEGVLVDDARIEQYLDLILEANKRINLTRIDSRESALILHVEDSLSALPELNEAPDGLYGDLGTGGGFPGAILSIASGRQTLLVDSVKKKIAVLDSVIAEIGLSEQIHTYDGRIEDLAREKLNAFSALTARALSQLASPLLKERGVLICYKSHVSDDEMDRALSMEKLVGMKLKSRRNFYLSDGVTFREIIVFEKIGSPTVKLPRRVGLAQKKPLR